MLRIMPLVRSVTLGIFLIQINFTDLLKNAMEPIILMLVFAPYAGVIYLYRSFRIFSRINYLTQPKCVMIRDDGDNIGSFSYIT